MEKKDLIEKFDKLEAEILKLVRLPEINLDESTKKQTLKANIKKHILAVEKAKVLFEEYEKLALQIEEFDKPKKEKTNKAETKTEDKEIKKAAKDEYKDEVVVTNGEVKVVKKKNTKSSSKQM